jgi:transposase
LQQLIRRAAMELYIGMDVSLKETSICVVDGDGEIVVEGSVLSEPSALAAFIGANAPQAKRIGLETGPTATWLWHALRELDLPVICIDARHAKAALSMQVNKSDRNDAVGLARIMQCGWYKEVQVKRLSCHEVRAVLNSRALLVKTKRNLENQIRGLLKNLGLIIGKAGGNVFSRRVDELLAGQPVLREAIRPLLEVRDKVRREIAVLFRGLREMAREDINCRRSMTVPGVGPITALTFYATIDDPGRFRRSRSVGAYLGLTSRRHASGEIDWSGRISKCGDRMLRSYLFEAAGVLLTRVPKWCALKVWGHRLWKRIGFKKAKIAVARRLAVILQRMWCDETDFQWSNKEAAA